jgi:circadian clock protein KaiC
MSDAKATGPLEKVATGIPGFDTITMGGLPKGRTTLVSGTAGSAKTVFACQFLAQGIINGGTPGVFVTFEESVEDLRRNMAGFGWDIAEWERQGKWAFVDASPAADQDTVVVGRYDFGALIARVEHAVEQVGAKNVAMDSIGAIMSRYTDHTPVRGELLRIAQALRGMDVTTIMTSERTTEYGGVARYGVEEFVADNVVILRNTAVEEQRRRTMEVLKFRGATHQKGEYPFTIVPGRGLVIIPLSAMELRQKSSNIRITSGNQALDEMCGGGFFRDSVILVSGATGTGKTLITCEFVRGGFDQGEKTLLFAFEESLDQLVRNATGWGVDFERMQREGKLKVVCTYPEGAGLEDHLVMMKDELEAFKPDRVVVDSLSALERIAGVKGFREFVIGLTSLIKHLEVAGLFTASTPSLMGGTSVTEAHISTITDCIILLRYVEMWGETRRGVTVLKMRGSLHDKDIREFEIDAEGMHIGKPFRHVTGILSGHPTHITEDELNRLDSLFEE